MKSLICGIQKSQNLKKQRSKWWLPADRGNDDKTDGVQGYKLVMSSI